MEALLDRTKLFDTENYEYNKDSKVGVLLIHGFTNTTYELKKLRDFLASKNFHVLCENLPGHGTDVNDCNNTKYTDWMESVEQRFAYLSSQCDYTFVCGISMGALLAMHLSTVFPVSGLISAAPVLEFNKPFKIHFLNRLLCHLFKHRFKKYEVNPGQKIYYGYNKWPLIALNQVRKLSAYVNKNVLQSITCPTLLIHSKRDYTSVFNNYSIAKKNIPSNDVTSIIITESPHNFFDCDIEKKILHDGIEKFINKHIN